MQRRPCRWSARCVVPLILLLSSADLLRAQGPTPVDATRSPTRILAHYMPWYEAKPHSPHWGWHWTMGVFDPESKKAGKPAIASHYRPLIGPYDSGDPDVIEYHALLMKLAGIDGAILDWYGTVDHLDYAGIHRHSSAFAQQAARTGLEFAVCYEDQTIPKLIEGGRLKSSRTRRARPARDRMAPQELVRHALLSQARQSAGVALLRTRRL